MIDGEAGGSRRSAEVRKIAERRQGIGPAATN
jgi:hypothetical protein